MAHESQRDAVHEARRGALDASLLIAGLVFPSLAAWLYFAVYASSPALPALYIACKIAQFVLPIAWLLLVLRRLPDRRLPDFRAVTGGVLSGLLLAAIVMLFYVVSLRGGALAAQASPRIAARLEALHSATPLGFAAMALFLSVAHSLLEEYYWRWFAFGRLRIHMGRGGAIALSSVAFAAHHVIVLHAFIGPGRFWWVTAVLSIAVAAAGALWAWQYTRSGSLISIWISHALVDVAIMAIGYDLVRPLI